MISYDSNCGKGVRWVRHVARMQNPKCVQDASARISEGPNLKHLGIDDLSEEGCKNVIWTEGAQD